MLEEIKLVTRKETWQPVASSNSLQPHIRHKVLEELRCLAGNMSKACSKRTKVLWIESRRTETEAPQFGDSCGDDVDVGDSSGSAIYGVWLEHVEHALPKWNLQ